MLKLTYTENNFNLERVNESLEDWVNTRDVLALRLATKIHIEPSTASFLVPANLERLADLEKVAEENFVKLYLCDAEYVEVALRGLWLTSDAESETGVFVTALLPSTELLLLQLSQSEQFCSA